jgi:uncharacterized membrane protein (DUF485 family)
MEKQHQKTRKFRLLMNLHFYTFYYALIIPYQAGWLNPIQQATHLNPSQRLAIIISGFCD